MSTGRTAAKSASDLEKRSRAEQLLNETGRMARIGGWEHDLATGKASWTEALHEVIEIPPEKIPGVEEHLDYYPPKDRAILKEAYYRAIAEGVPFDLELQGITGTGKLRWWRVYGEPVYDKGKCVKMRGILHDITERKEAQAHLAESEQLYRSVLESISDAVYLTDEAGDFTFVCRNVDVIFGYSSDEIAEFGNVERLLDLRCADYQELKRVGAMNNIEVAIRDKADREHHLIVNAKAVDILGSKMLFTCRDITERKEADLARRRSEESFKTFLDNLADVAYMADTNGILTYTNKAGEEATGISRDELIGNLYLPLFVEENQNVAREAYQQCLTGQSVQIELTLTNGRIFAFKSEPQYSRDGEIVGVLGIAREITSAKRAEAELRSNQTQLKTLINTLPDLVWRKDQNGVYLGCNKRFEEFFGATEAEIVGKTDYDFMDKGLADFFRAHDRAAAAAGKPTMNEEEITFASDGHREWLETIKTPMFDSDGKLVGVLGIGRDITARKRVEEELRESEQNLREAQNVARIGSWTWDLATGAATWSEQVYEIFKAPHEEPSYEYAKSFVHPDDRGLWQGTIEAAVNDEKPFAFDYRCIRGDGETIWVRNETVMILDAAGELTGYRGTVQDITERKQAEEALKENELKFRLVTETIQDVFWMSSIGVGEMLYVSPSYETLWERSRESLYESPQSFLEAIHPEDLDSYLEELSVKHDKGLAYEIEYRIVRKDGSIRWILEKGFPVPLQGSRKQLMTGVCTDITDRKRVELALGENEQKYRTLFENMMNGFALHEIVLDEDGKPIDYLFLEVNNAFERMTGLKREDIIGRRVTEVIAGIENDPANWIQRYGKVATTGEAQKFEQHSAALAKSYSVLAFSPEPGRFATIFDDITERRQAIAALVESEERFRNVVESMSDWVWEVDAEGKYTFASENVREVLGYTADEVVGKTPFDFMPQEEAERIGLLFSRITANHEPIRDLENWNLHKDGQLVCLQTNGVPLLSEEGNLLGYRGVDKDITERMTVEQALQESNAQLEEAQALAKLGSWTMDVSSGIGHWSKQMFRLFDLDPANGAPTYEEGIDLFHPEDREAVLTMYSSLISEGGSAELVCRTNPERGPMRYLEVKFYDSGEESGRVARLAGTTQDITERKTAEQALQESEEKFRLLSDQSLMGIVIAQNDRFSYVNQRGADILEASIEEILHSTLADILAKVHPDDRELVTEQARKKQSGEPGTIPHYSWRLQNNNGRSNKWIETWSKSIAYQGGTADMITMIDITDRKRAEDALRESEEKFRELTNDLPQIVFETDLEGRLTYVNDLAFAKMGYSRAEFEAGLSAFDMVAPECRQEAVESTRRIVAGDETGGKEYIAIRKNGTKFPIFIHSRLKVTNGKPAGLRGIVFDITDQKKAEEAIRASEAKLSNAMKFAKLGHWEYDVAENLFTFNDEFYALFRTTAEAEGGYRMTPQRYVERFLHPDDASLVASETRSALETDDPNFSRKLEHRIIYADDELGHIAVQFFVVKDADGNTIKTYGVNQDITERVQMQKELAKADKLESVGLLAGGIAHDFNNILTAIMGNISLAKIGVSEGTEVYDCLTEAENASGRAVQLTAQLLTFAKGGAPILEATSIAEIIRESASFGLRGSNVKCDFDLPAELAMVNADTGQLSQVINNLIINADQAMPDGGTIKISAENVDLPATNKFSLAAGDYVKVTIADQGVGIPAKHLSRVFDPFFTTKQKGNGLGLASVYSIIKKHTGHITVDSIVGEGTTFTIYLPAIKARRRVRARGSATELVQGSGRVLVVDDEDSVRRLASAILTRLGYQVEVVDEGAAGIELYQKARTAGEPFDLVVLDLTIPGGLGGQETLERLREIDPEVRAIVSSGYSTDQVMANYRDYGFNGRISKPFGVAEFSKVIQEVMAVARDPV